MAIDRQRPLLPDVFQDEELLEQDLETRFLLVGLRMFADDEGREIVAVPRLKAALFLYDDAITADSLLQALVTLDDLGYLTLYDVDGRTYFQLSRVPSVSHPKPSRFPPLADGYPSASGPLANGSAREREREWGEGDPGESPDVTSSDIPPSPFCPAHRPFGTDQKCRNCGTHRLGQEQWLREHRRSSTSS